MKKVIIVNAGGFLGRSAEAGDYDNYVATLKDVLETSHSPEEKQKAAEVEVVSSGEQVMTKIETEAIDVLVFVSRSMLRKAEEIQAAHPRLKVVLFTGAFPERQVIVIDKGWMMGNDAIRNLILH